MAKEALVGPEVCKDPVRLTTYAVGVNVFKQGEDPPLKAHEEYPEWYVVTSYSVIQVAHCNIVLLCC